MQQSNTLRQIPEFGNVTNNIAGLQNKEQN